ncbi:hypothetical protein [Streptomyces swartbergensis]|uniref:Uncharacterized protein n=1 Tax=Streptomyces swartbergensis TaxID=487165 RepID=A0A243SAC7_9ACTN|nr:hypothetical protein [Streptomyces swartbergensis]OUD04663.1 hypothetical protein CA983_02590 [Streptomyces swartbergensis]
MPLFRRTPKPQGYRPTDREVADAAARLNAGSHHAAYDLTAHSGDRQQETVMRILGHCVEDAE